MDHVEVTEDRISTDHTTSLVSSPTCGAISVFIGLTPVHIYIFTPNLVYYLYRVVPVEEASIVIAVSSPHRKESLEAVGYAIDTVKAVVPIWKKEIYADESSAWKENKECIWTS
ncbi:molybdopterin synthase catalytic subunit-like [Mizuhopecten yessoensis]|uniref:molybdopterin synthase catalytic subunit-like n=1 Tax=Mizuhopecten yessoensis TaxID=6573 RepID=UPI000B45B9CC|nr:molybdopterin synthase catalytic subunit-like [Mizuhopecten yessoensis]